MMQELRQARPAHLSGDGTVGQNLRAAELSRALEQSRTAQPKHRQRRTMILSMAATGVAGATALAVIAVTAAQSPPSSPAPAPHTGTPAFLAAARKAATQPAGAFWDTDVIHGQSYVLPAGYAITGAAGEDFSWIAVKAGGGDLFYARDLPARPATGKDAAAWRAAGSPSSFRVFSNDHYATYTTKPGPWGADTPGHGGRFWLPGKTAHTGMTSQQIQALPTDPAALTRLFFQPTAQAKAYAAKSRKNAREIAAMWAGPYQVGRASEIFAAPLPPKVRAGLMRAFAQQPGVRQLGTVTDPLGRRGIAIGADWGGQAGHPKSGPHEREELIFDAKTGAYLGDEQVLITPGGQYRHQPPGFVISYELMRSSGWTDTKPTPPRTLPFP
jgi:hypothetical protein